VKDLLRTAWKVADCGQGGPDSLPVPSGGTTRVRCASPELHISPGKPPRSGSGRGSRDTSVPRSRKPLEQTASRDPLRVPAGEDVVRATRVPALLQDAAQDVPAVMNTTGAFCAEHAGLPVPLAVPGVSALGPLAAEGSSPSGGEQPPALQRGTGAHQTSP